jgi:hypothetical protein
MSVYDDILFDMINKKLNLDNVLDLLFDLAISCQFRYDIHKIFGILFCIDDINLAQDFLQIIYNGTCKFYDYFCKLDKYNLKNDMIIKKYVDNLIKNEYEIDIVNERLKNTYYSIGEIVIDCNMLIVL